MNALNTSATLVNRDLSLSFVLGDADGFITYLRDNGLKAGKKPVAELIAGKRDEVCGFYLVPADPVAPEAVADAPKASAADVKPDFSGDAVAEAVAAALAAGVPVVTAKAPEVAADKAPRAPRAAKVMKSVEPKGKVKPVRKGTKIAIGLEMLLAGTTAEALVAADVTDDAVDFCNRRVTKRGYGVVVSAEGVKLVNAEIVYNA